MTTPDDKREIRQGNYAVKYANDFQCAECGRNDGVLAVTEKRTGELTTRCETCLDRRTHEVRPFQWDEAEELRAELRAKQR